MLSHRRSARNWWRSYAVALTAVNAAYAIATVRLLAQVRDDMRDHQR